MNFRDLLLAAKNNDNIAFETILKMYEPLIMKESIINGFFDEDLYQEQRMVLRKCIEQFEL
ncbi:MAG: helix-turn-helix domain-containing protein [Acutalibacteraceae bacterium]